MQYWEVCDTKPSSREPMLLAASAVDEHATSADMMANVILVDAILRDMKFSPRVEAHRRLC
jgi:hypothetical protein